MKQRSLSRPWRKWNVVLHAKSHWGAASAWQCSVQLMEGHIKWTPLGIHSYNFQCRQSSETKRIKQITFFLPLFSLPQFLLIVNENILSALFVDQSFIWSCKVLSIPSEQNFIFCHCSKAEWVLLSCLWKSHNTPLTPPASENYNLLTLYFSSVHKKQRCRSERIWARLLSNFLLHFFSTGFGWKNMTLQTLQAN